MVRGEYLVWPDSDDFYSEQRSLSKMIEVLEAAPADVGCVRCLPAYVDERLQPLPPGNGVPRRLNPEEEWLFHDSIWGHNGFWYLSGGYIVRMSAVDRCIRDREIACAKNAGQSWQLLLPIFYRYRCLTVPEKLHTVVVRRDSHSRNYFNTYASLVGKHRDFEYVLLKTIERIEGMPQAESKALLREVREHYAKEYYLTAVRYGIRKEIRRTYGIIRKDYPGRMSAVEKLSGLLAWLACPESVIIFSLKLIRRYYAWREKK